MGRVSGQLCLVSTGTILLVILLFKRDTLLVTTDTNSTGWIGVFQILSLAINYKFSCE